MDNEVVVLKNEPVAMEQALAEPAAFAEIYNRCFPRVYNYVRYMLHRAEVADDITAQVFEKVLKRMNTYDPSRGSVDAWILAIARNVVNDHLRARRYRR